MKQAIAKMILSALIAGLLAGLTAYASGAAWKGACIGGVILALKDVQAYLSTPPKDA